MRFRVIRNRSSIPSEGSDVGFLWTDNWNDWFKYSTLYVLTYFDPDGYKHEIGNVKIGQFNWTKSQDRPALLATFAALDDRFFRLDRILLTINASPLWGQRFLDSCLLRSAMWSLVQTQPRVE